MARYLGPDMGESGPVPSLTPRPAAPSFDHYDEFGQPIDTNGDVMQVGFGTTWGPPPLDQAPETAPPEETTTPEQPAAAPAPVAPPVDSGGGGGAATPPPYLSGADNPFAPWSGHFDAPTAQPLPNVPVFTPPTYTPPPAFSWDEASHPAPVYTPPPAFAYGDFTAPTFTPPDAFSYGDFSYGDFKGPSIDEAVNDPGYQFRLQQGNDRLQNAASARGTLNDSGTLKALMDYGQDAASQEYQNVWQRDYGAYNTNRAGAVDQYNVNRANAADIYNKNYQTQYTDPYARNYQAALDQYTQNRGNALTNYNTNYQTQYVDPYNVAKDQWTTGRANALDQYKVNYQTQYADPYAHSYQAAQDQFAPQVLGYQTDAANTQHLNDQRNTNAWNDYLLGYQDYENRRNLGANFALLS